MCSLCETSICLILRKLSSHSPSSSFALSSPLFDWPKQVGWLDDWLTGLLACWLVSWPSRMLLYHANGMNHAYWSLVPTDWLTQTLSAAQLYRTELSWTELKSSQVKSNRVKSTVPVAKCRRRLHRRRCCRRFKPTFIFFSRSVDRKQEAEM